jgi:hypothetical protein
VRVGSRLQTGGLLGLEGNFDEFLVGEDFESELEGGGRNVGRFAEVVVGHCQLISLVVTYIQYMVIYIHIIHYIEGLHLSISCF